MVLTVLSQKFTKYCLISLIWRKHRQRSGRGGGGAVAKIRVWYRKHLYDCWHRRAHTHSSTLRRLKNYLKSTMNQDRLNKLEQLPKDALSQIDYWHRWKNVVPTKNAKGILENLSSGMPMAEWKMSSSSSKRPPPLRTSWMKRGQRSVLCNGFVLPFFWFATPAA